MQGQANHFFRYAPEKIPYGIQRYQNETRRLYSVLETHLSKPGNKGYLVGDRVTIADIAHWGWVRAAGWAGVEIDDFPKLKEWEERLGEREAFKKGRNVPPTEKDIKELAKDAEKAEEEARKSRDWVQAGMKADHEKHGGK